MIETNFKKKVNVLLKSPNDIRDFVDTLTHCSATAEFVSSNQKVDATSLMGIFTLNVLEPHQLIISASSDERLDKTISAIDKFLAKE